MGWSGRFLIFGLIRNIIWMYLYMYTSPVHADHAWKLHVFRYLLKKLDNMEVMLMTYNYIKAVETFDRNVTFRYYHGSIWHQQVFSSTLAGITQPLPEPASCRFVRLHPKTYKIHPCLMLELHGCVPWREAWSPITTTQKNVRTEHVYSWWYLNP